MFLTLLRHLESQSAGLSDGEAEVLVRNTGFEARELVSRHRHFQAG